MGELVVRSSRFENNFLLVLRTHRGVLRLQEDKFVVWNNSNNINNNNNNGCPCRKLESNYGDGKALCPVVTSLTWAAEAKLDETSVVRGVNNYWSAGIVR